MWAVFAGILKPGAKDHPDEYLDRPFDMFVSYYDTGIYRLPYEWSEKYGPGKQMDWGSWIHFCDRNGLWELMSPEKPVVQVLPADEKSESAKRLPAIKAGEIPKDEWYGVLEVECY